MVSTYFTNRFHKVKNAVTYFFKVAHKEFISYEQTFANSKIQIDLSEIESFDFQEEQ